VAEAAEIPVGERKLISVDGRSLGVFNVGGTFVSVLNVCPHALAPVCLGRVSGTTLPSEPGEYRWGREGEVLTCPWHGWEFDLRTGTALTGGKLRLRLYPTEVENGTVFVRLPHRDPERSDGTP
jgi:3-phenylpropionate/trans-cinnamate dioxygenase ferredoxin subunit